MRLLPCLVLLFLASTVHAETKLGNPLTYTIEKNNLILNTDKKSNTSVYLLKNKYSQSIWIDRVVIPNKGASAGFTSYLRPNHWSAIATRKANFTISCAIMQPGKVSYVDCNKALEVKIPAHLTMDKPLKGTYWLAEDKEWEELVKELNKRKVSFLGS